MNKKDLALVFLVSVIWGGNFVVIKLGLHDVPPMLLAALRYIATAFPAVLFVKPPRLEWRYTIAYGLTIGFGQFSCLFYAMTIGMPAGLASIILQSQAFFTAFFAVFFLAERLRMVQLLGLAIAVWGLFCIGGAKSPEGVLAVPLGALSLTLAAAAFWGLSNIVVRSASMHVRARGERLDIVRLIVWSSLVPPLPLLGLAFLMEETRTIVSVTSGLTVVSVFAILYLAYLGTLFGSSRWSGLLARYPTGKVAPFSLLVPVTSLFLAKLILGEVMTLYQFLGSLIVLAGLSVVHFEPVIKESFLRLRPGR
ncbi:MAG: EamA family transporter [Synergistales bacterium]|nr:EamA family transporter [Synergistales bacterium]